MLSELGHWLLPALTLELKCLGVQPASLQVGATALSLPAFLLARLHAHPDNCVSQFLISVICSRVSVLFL